MVSTLNHGFKTIMASDKVVTTLLTIKALFKASQERKAKDFLVASPMALLGRRRKLFYKEI